MNTPEISARVYPDGLSGRLRVDPVRYNTLLHIAQAWLEDGGREDIIDAFDQLADLLQRPRSEGDLDAAVQRVEDSACMDYAEIEITREQVRRLRADLGRVEAALTLPRIDGEHTVPQQRDAGRGAA